MLLNTSRPKAYILHFSKCLKFMTKIVDLPSDKLRVFLIEMFIIYTLIIYKLRAL